MAAAGTQSVGSLIIDIRANLATLQADMDQVKSTVAKSSREMSSQMKQDMNETRQVLALMRDDFGVGVPRELRKIIASSEMARDAILGMSTAFFGLAFINLGVEVFKKIADYFSKAAEEAKKEAEETRQIFDNAQKAVDATRARAMALELIGKGEEERHAIEKKHFEEEIQHDKLRLASKQAQLALDLAAINLSLKVGVFDPGTGMEVGKTDQEDDSEFGMANRTAALKKFNEENKETFKSIAELSKAIDDAVKGGKASDLQLADYEKNLSISRLKNSEQVALADVELKKDTIQKMYAAGKVGLDQELMALRTAATEKYNINLRDLQGTLDILEKDPSRNKEKIEQVNTQILLANKALQKDLTDIYYQGVTERKKLADEEAAMNAAVAKALMDSNKDHGLLPSDLTTPGGGAPQFGGGSKASFIAAQLERFKGTFKDGAEQGKMLTKVYEDMLTPAEKFSLVQQEISFEMSQPGFKNSPEILKQLHNEILKANPEFQKLMAASAEFGKDLSNELDTLLIKGGSFHDFLINIAKDIEEIALKALLLKPLENFFSGGSSGTGGIFSSLGKLFSGLGFAGGGSPPTGQFSLVGENGPELFMPSTSGTIIPNNALGGGVNNNFYIDAKGAAAGAEEAIIRGIKRALEQNKQSSIAGAVDYQRRR
jgi:hypothetical protein